MKSVFYLKQFKATIALPQKRWETPPPLNGGQFLNVTFTTVLNPAVGANRAGSLKFASKAVLNRAVRVIRAFRFWHVQWFGCVCTSGHGSNVFLHWTAIIVREFTNLQIIKFSSFG